MHWINIGLILVAGLNIGLALLVWLRNPKHKINITFALGIMGVAFWGASEGLMFLSSSPKSVAFYGSATYFFGIFVAFNFYLFSVYFPYQLHHLKKWLILLFSFGFIVISIISFIPGMLIKDGVVGGGSHNDLILVPTGFWIYSAFFLTIFILGFYNLFLKYSRSDGFMRIQLKYVTFGILIVFIFATIFDLLIPYFKGEVLGWVGPYATLIMVFVTTYILFFAGKKIYIR